MLSIAIANLFLIFTGVGLVIPVMPQLMQDMHFSGTVMGMMLSVFSIAQFITSPITGIFSDKFGRKSMICLGMLLFAISEFIFGGADDKYIFYFSRALGGISAALIMPAVTAYVADLTSIQERPKAMGYVSGAISGGFIIGPGLGGFLATFGHRMPFYAAGVLALVGGLLTIVFLKESTHFYQESITKIDVASDLTLRKFFRLPGMPFIFLIIFISSFGLQAFESIYTIMTAINFGFSSAEIAFIITISGILALIFQVFLFDFIVRKIGEIGLIQASFFASALFIFIIAFTRNNILFILSTFVVFLAFDLFRPAVTTYLSKKAGGNQGAVNGLNSTFTSFGNIVGPVCAGYFFDLSQHLPYFISACILLVTGLLSLFVQKQKTTEI